HLVELRLVTQGTDRAGQSRMGRGPFWQGAWRRDRVHSAAGEVKPSRAPVGGRKLLPPSGPGMWRGLLLLRPVYFVSMLIGASSSAAGDRRRGARHGRRAATRVAPRGRVREQVGRLRSAQPSTPQNKLLCPSSGLATHYHRGDSWRAFR